MTSKPVAGIRIKGNKVEVKPPRMDASKRKRIHAQAAKQEAKWRAKSK